jgi:hypothetical protein
MRKAALLAELDEVGEAHGLVRSALLEVRKAQRTQGKNIELLSLEGWCTYLAGFLDAVLDLAKLGDAWDEFGERSHELESWYCDPWRHKRYFDSALSADPPKPTKPRRWSGASIRAKAQSRFISLPVT